MNADSKGLQARDLTARSEAPGWRFTNLPSLERARQAWLLVPPEPLRGCTLSASIGESGGVRCRILSRQATIQFAQAAGYSDWLADDEAALNYLATRVAPKFGVSVEVIAKRLRVDELWPPW